MRRLPTRKIEDVLRLHAQGMATRRIALATGVGKTTVIEYLRRAAVAGLYWSLPEGLDEEALEGRVFPPPPPSHGRQLAASDWAMVHRELKRPGVPLALLWDEYRGQHPDGYGYSAFCEHYRCWVGRLSGRTCGHLAAQERQALEAFDHRSHRRNETLRASKYLGRPIWRKWSGYHRRSRAETKMNCLKLLGQSLMARDFDRQVAELRVRAAVLNACTALGIPVTRPVG